MKTIRKSLVSIVLTASFLLLAMSMQVFPVHAETEGGNEALIVETGVEYATLNDAKAAAQRGQTLKLLKDIDLGSSYFQTAEGLNLDLNGHTITSSASFDTDVSRRGTVSFVSDYSRSGKIIDSSAGKTGSIINTGNGYAIYTRIFFTLTIEDGNFISNLHGIMCGGETIINGGKIEAAGTALHHFHGGHNVNINGGVIKGGRTLAYVTWNDRNSGMFYVNGGYFSDDVANYPGTVRKTGMRLFKVGGKGEYKDYYELRTEVAKRISGSSETFYSDLQDAVSSAADGDTVVVLADCETNSLLINKGITLDLNGKTITENGVMKAKARTITIKDSSATEEAEGTGRIDFTKEDGNYTLDVVGDSAKLLLNSGTLHAENNTVIRVSEGAAAEVEGGTVSAGKCGIYVGVNSRPIYEGSATVSGGTVSGAEYGIYVFNGSSTVTQNAIVISSDGKSVGMEEDQQFTIYAGKFSDDAGNADGFDRPSGKHLCGFKEDGVLMYRLGTAEAYNETTGKYIEKLDYAKDFLSGDDNVIKVLRDINNGSEAIYMSNKFVLDLNGHTITGNVSDRNKGVLCLTDEGELTITDSSENKTGAVINNYSGNTDEGYAIWIDEDTKLTIEDGTVKSNNAGIYCGETIIMNGGKIDAGGRAIYLFPFDTTVVINDGILKSGDDDPIFYFPYNRPGPEVTVNGGYFSNTSISDEDRISRKDNMPLVLVGGSGEYKDYYELKAVVAKVVAGENETFLGELQEAVNRAAAGNTVVVLTDCETDSLLINKGITLDLNGKTVTETGVMKATYDYYANQSHLTIKDSSASEGAEGSGRIEFTKEDGDYTFELTGIRTDLLLESGTLHAEKNTVFRLNGDADVTISGGTVSGGKNGIVVGESAESRETGSIVKIEGGTVSGNEYGIYLFKGMVFVYGEPTIIGAKGKSVGKEARNDGRAFVITGGRFSDAAGNGSEFGLPDGKYLADPDEDGWYELTDVDKTVLEAAIEAARAAEEGVATSTDGKDVDPDKKWTTEEEKQALDDAITAAQAVFDAPSATQKEIGAAVRAVTAATETYNNAKKDGSKEAVVPDKSELEAAIEAARAAEEGVETSEDGKDVDPDKKWTTEAEKQALDDAIAAAQAVADKEDATQDEINEATQAIKNATDTYNSAKKDGSKEEVVPDKSELEAAIETARAAEEGTATSADGKDVDSDKKWTTEAEKQALDEAITAAQAVADKEDATQEEIDEATQAIKNATDTYNSAKKDGSKEKVEPTPEPTPTPKPEPKPSPGTDPNQKGKDGTAVGPGASAAAADRAITRAAGEEGPKGTKHSPVALRSSKQGKKNVALTWNKVKGAKTYVVYGNACGKKYKMKKLATVKTNRYNVKKISKKLKKGTYYKFIVVALDANKNVVSTSKVAHIATKGGKVTNYRRVSVRKSVISKAKKLKKGRTLKLQARQIKQGKGKVRKHRALSYESSNTKIAVVSKKGVVKGKAKGSCYITAYTQSGTYKRIKVTVR